MFLITWFLSDFVTQKAAKDQQLTKKRRKADKNADEKAEELKTNAILALVQEAVQCLVAKVLGLSIHVLWKD